MRMIVAWKPDVNFYMMMMMMIDYKLYFYNWNNLNQWPAVKIRVDLGVKSQFLNGGFN